MAVSQIQHEERSSYYRNVVEAHILKKDFRTPILSKIVVTIISSNDLTESALRGPVRSKTVLMKHPLD